MNELKKFVTGLNGQVAFFINAGFAFLFILFLFLLPILSSFGGSATITELKGFWNILSILVMVILPLAVAILPLLKKNVCHCYVCALAVFYTAFVFGASAMGAKFMLNIGFGFFINLILVLIPWAGFLKLRAGFPIDLNDTNATTNTPNIPKK